jgi:hypothetical protein
MREEGECVWDERKEGGRWVEGMKVDDEEGWIDDEQRYIDGDAGGLYDEGGWMRMRKGI